jgi:small subunit ribosomal protein S16
MLKIRLRRIGAKFQPHYRVVVADARAPRDGRFVSILGYYDPRTNPATIHLDAAQVEDWVRKGAQPTAAVIGLLRQAKLAPSVIEAYSRQNPNSARVQGAAEVTAAAAAAETADQAEAPPGAAAPGTQLPAARRARG